MVSRGLPAPVDALRGGAECMWKAAGCASRIGRVIQEGRGRRRRWEERDVLEAGYAVAEQIRLEPGTSAVSSLNRESALTDRKLDDSDRITSWLESLHRRGSPTSH